jgi:hypothetical protein
VPCEPARGRGRVRRARAVFDLRASRSVGASLPRAKRRPLELSVRASQAGRMYLALQGVCSRLMRSTTAADGTSEFRALPRLSTTDVAVRHPSRARRHPAFTSRAGASSGSTRMLTATCCHSRNGARPCCAGVVLPDTRWHVSLHRPLPVGVAKGTRAVAGRRKMLRARGLACGVSRGSVRIRRTIPGHA